MDSYITRSHRLWIGLLLVAFSILCASAASPKRVLILNPFGRDVEPFSSAVSGFRSTLARELGEPVDFHEIPLELGRFTGPEGEAPLVAFLEERIENHPVDLVVPIGGAGVQFAARHRDRLFPETPILAVAAEPRMVPPGFLEENATLVTQRVELPGMIEDILQMQPDTSHIAVVFGSSQLEKIWLEECRREFRKSEGRVKFIWMNDLTLEQLVEKCSKLPPRSFILHGLFIVDAVGVPSDRNEALLRLHESSNAPIFAPFSSEFGMGAIGGRLFQNSEIGEQGGRMAVRILRGENASQLPPLILETAVPVYDWRELRRWKIPEANLPSGGVIKFRQPDFWEHYRWPALGVASLGIIQAALIAGLLINRAKRRRGEEATALIADISSKFVNIPASEVDREIHDAQYRICKLLDIDVSVLWQWTDHAPGLFNATHIHSLTGGPQPPMQIEADNFPWVRQEILSARAVILGSLDEMPAEASKDRDTASRSGIRSSLSLPLSLGGDSPIGILCFNTTRKERSWPPDIVERLKLVAEIVANALARKKADHDLRESSEAKRLAMQQTMELRDTLAHTGRVSLLGQLASALAHELSQPLGAILRNAEAAEIMLQQAAPDIEELRAIVDDILRDDQRAGGVINKLRSLLGKGELKLEPLDLPEVISDVLALLRSDATVRHVQLDTDIEPGLPKILGDRIHLQQVLLNLIVNAIDALAEQDATDRSLRVLARMTDPATVEARVCDNGPGIPDDRLTRLFEPFYTTKATGMGMGLPVSKTIIEAHKGKLTAENRPDGGACFCFTLQTTLPDSTP